MSGGFAQINEPTVNELMHDRFKMAQRKSPFESKKYDNHITIIHYRLGDKKATPLQMQFTKDFNTDLIIDPSSYSKVLSTIKKLDLQNIYVVSDEPKLAQHLLLQIGVKAKIRPNTGNIWADLEFMSSASNFIGTKSQVSQLANILVEHNGGKSYMLNFKKHKNYHQFKNTTYLDANFIEPSNEIYKVV
jgi:hypothetical protein